MKISNYLKEHVTLKQVAESYTKLEKKGASYMGSCPLGHSDSNPSFSVRPDRGYYHCFSCGQSGDLISLVQQAEGVGFTDACRIIVERFGIPAPVKLHNRSIRAQIKRLEEEGRREEAIQLIDQLRREK